MVKGEEVTIAVDNPNDSILIKGDKVTYFCDELGTDRKTFEYKTGVESVGRVNLAGWQWDPKPLKEIDYKPVTQETNEATMEYLLNDRIVKLEDEVEQLKLDKVDLEEEIVDLNNEIVNLERTNEGLRLSLAASAKEKLGLVGLNNKSMCRVDELVSALVKVSGKL